MKVRLDTSLVWFGVAYHHGDIIDLPDDVAEKYIATRQAERIAVEPEAVVEVETATLDRSRPNQMRQFHKHKRG